MKNIVEGMGIGRFLLTVYYTLDMVLAGLSKALLTATDGKKTVVPEKEIITARQDSVNSQIIEQGKTQKKEPGFRGAKK